MKRTYENALRLLETRRRTTRPKGTVPSIASATVQGHEADRQALRGVPSLSGMRDWLYLLGHSDADIDGLNIIHVAGTKGKGSTCAFTRSFLSAHALRTGFPRKIGLYTSPDLRCIRERIQIDGEPIGRDLFTKYFFEVWERLQLGSEQPAAGSSAPTGRQPRYLQFLALMAFHAFIREDVEAAIFETHHGGEYDSTNVVRRPVVTAVTSLGMDHVAQLGPTIDDIAWHKAGIFKQGVPAFSAPQDQGPAAVLRKRAADKRAPLQFVPAADESLPSCAVGALSVPVQVLNCSLAVALARAFLHSAGPAADSPEHVLSTEDIELGVRNFHWPGRFETIREQNNAEWFLDGAHNSLSLEQAAEWFASHVSMSGRQKRRILIFSHYSEERDGTTLVEDLANALHARNARPDHVIFTTYQEYEDSRTRLDKTLRIPETPFPDFLSIYAELWKRLDPGATVSTQTTIEAALKGARSVGSEADAVDGFQALITGSLHLVGGALNLLQDPGSGTSQR